ncbi:MAG TPA: PadR family transcriptional regulator [Pyrinomonadaceae bacterium]|jgi:PadR family transcriptional regulator, regulatory protein PadR|nr:PadR family transcriptional regulator [Pyrinomonadaceae bacterium]
MGENKHEVLPGTLNLLVLKTLATMGPLHGYGIARRIEQVSGDLLELNQGTIYPALLKLEQLGWIRSKWSVSENNRRAKFYSLTRAGQKQLVEEEDEWNRTSAIVTRFLTPAEKSR